jgi:hypothetical protein
MDGETRNVQEFFIRKVATWKIEEMGTIIMIQYYLEIIIVIITTITITAATKTRDFRCCLQY